MAGYTKEYVDPSEFYPGAEDEYLAMKELEQEPAKPNPADMRRKYRLLSSSQNKGLPNPLKAPKHLKHRTGIGHTEAVPEDNGTAVKLKIEELGQDK
jgi:hypothetical protein